MVDGQLRTFPGGDLDGLIRGLPLPVLGASGWGAAQPFAKVVGDGSGTYPSTTSTSWVLQSSFTITLPRAQRVMVGMQGNTYGATAPITHLGVGFDGDTAPTAGEWRTRSYSSQWDTIADTWISPVLAKGQHTVKVFWKISSSGTIYLFNGSAADTYVFWAMGIPPDIPFAYRDGGVEGDSDWTDSSGTFQDVTDQYIELELTEPGRIWWGMRACALRAGSNWGGGSVGLSIDGETGWYERRIRTRDVASGYVSGRAGFYGVTDVLDAGVHTFQQQAARVYGGTLTVYGISCLWAMAAPPVADSAVGDQAGNENFGSASPPATVWRDSPLTIEVPADGLAYRPFINAVASFRTANVGAQTGVDTRPVIDGGDLLASVSRYLNRYHWGDQQMGGGGFFLGDEVAAGSHDLELRSRRQGSATTYVYNTATLAPEVGVGAVPVYDSP